MQHILFIKNECEAVMFFTYYVQTKKIFEDFFQENATFHIWSQLTESHNLEYNLP